MSECFNLLVDAGFTVERIVEPDSRKRYPIGDYDPWYGPWEFTLELLELLPPTIIFKSRKR